MLGDRRTGLQTERDRLAGGQPASQQPDKPGTDCQTGEDIDKQTKGYIQAKRRTGRRTNRETENRRYGSIET